MISVAMDQDLYGILGIKPDAKLAEIRRAYRKKAIKCHPDRNPGNPEAERQFKEIARAYDVLSNEDSRSAYDRARAERTRPAPPPPNYPVADIAVELDLEGWELRNGCEKTVTVSKSRTCPDCLGSGHLSGRYWEPCALCNGAGCQPCGFTGSLCCARCWGSGVDRDLTTIAVLVPQGTPPHGRRRFVAMGDLWGLRGPFYIDANVTFKVQRPGLIIR